MRLYWLILLVLAVIVALLWFFFGGNEQVRNQRLSLKTPLTEAAEVIYGDANLAYQAQCWAQQADTPYSFHAPPGVPTKRLDLTPRVPDALVNDLAAPTERIKYTKQCKKYFQKLTQRVAERIWGVPFLSEVRKKTVPWLKNPQTGATLELDMYCPELRLAIEYNGPTHYDFPNQYHPETAEGWEKFRGVVERDEMKLNLCDENGVHLIVVPYSIHDMGEGAEKQIEIWLRYFAPDAMAARQAASDRGVKLTGGPETPFGIRQQNLAAAQGRPEPHWSRRPGDAGIETYDVLED